MNNILPRMAALAFALTVPALAQHTLVNFSAVDSNLANGVSSPEDATSVSEERWNFDLTSPLFGTLYPIYGGVRVANGSGQINTNATYMKLSKSSSAWPNAPKLFVNSTANNTTTVANVVDAAFLWKRGDFLTNGARVAFDATSSLSVNVTDWANTGTVSGQIRFLIKNGDTYYVSEANRGTAGTLTLADFNNNGAAGKRWAVLAPSGNTLALPNSGLTFAAVNFDDVQAVGWIGRGARAYATLYGFDTFQATGVVRENAPIMSMNLAFAYDYGKVNPFIDLLRVSNTNTWQSQRNGSFGNKPVPLDSFGWPNGIPFVADDGLQHTAARTIKNFLAPGQCLIRFKGTGYFEVNMRGYSGRDVFSSSRIASLPVDSEGYRSALLRAPTFTDPSEGTFIWLEIKNSNDDPNTPERENLHDFQILQPGYTAQQAKDLIFRSDFVSQSSMYHTIRYMDWGLTNGSTLTNWSQRKLPTASNQAGQVAIEYMIAFSNATNTNLWYCVPHRATDDFVSKLAKIIRHGSKANGEPFDPAVDPVSARVWPGLDPALKVYVEYSNETWNNLFSQNDHIIAEGDRMLAEGYPMGNNGEERADRFHSYRSAQIWRKFYDVFDTDAGTRLVRVLGCQKSTASASRRLEAFRVPGLITNGQYPDVIANAPYFGGNIPGELIAQGRENTVTIPEILALLDDEVDAQVAVVSGTRAIADAYGVRLINYEGGQHMVGTGTNYTMNDKIEAANRDPGMGAVYDKYLAMLYANGVSEHAHFNDIQNPSGRYGCWGAQEYIGQPLSQAPKANALVNFIANNTRTNQAPLARYAALNVTDTDGNGTQTVTLDGTGSRDLETAIVEYTWRIGTTRLSGSLVNLNLAIGDYAGTLTVVDTDGAASVIPVSFSVLPANSDVTVYRSNFTGTAPALNTPWTQTSVLNTGLTQSGWTWGVRPNSSSNGITGGVNVNNKFCVNMRGPSSGFTTLAEALTTNSYLTLTLTPTAGKVLDLRGATLRFDLDLSTSSARRFAVMTSAGGFSEAAALYNSSEPSGTGARSIIVQVPAASAYNNLTGPTEIRLYLYHNQYIDKAMSLTGFELKSAVR